MKIALLGTGLATAIHSRTLRAIAPGVERWYVSRDRARAEAACARFRGSGALEGYGAAIDRPDLDAVLIGLPPSLHLEWTLRALSSGKHVILEKPPLLRSVDFRAVAEAAAVARRQVLVAENYVYKPLARLLRRTLERGELGDLRLIQLNALKRQPTGNWRDDAALSGQGALFEGGIHWISLLASLGPAITRVSAFQAGDRHRLDRSTAVMLEYASGAVAMLAYSWELGGKPNGVRWSACYGTRGTLHFETNGLVAWQTGRRWRVTLPGIRDLLGYRAMLRDFLDAMRHNRPPAYSLEAAERDIRLIEQAYCSIQSR